MSGRARLAAAALALALLGAGAVRAETPEQTFSRGNAAFE